MSPRQEPTQAPILDALPGLQQQLASEYGEMVSRAVIDRAAEEALDELKSARIQEFVSVLAWRRARARLRQGF